jgi:hypothetical protein
MWTVDNDTVYAADRTWVRDKDGRHQWVVVVKATFEFGPDGKLGLADEQLVPLHLPEYFGTSETSSLRYEADLVAPKPGTDLIMNASAHAPAGRPIRELAVELRVGQLRKCLFVRGESLYDLGLTGARMTDPEAFVVQPIRYEHAYGGTDVLDSDPKHQRIDIRNPVGVGVTKLHGSKAPNIYHPHGNPATVGPAGFGAVAGHWSPRRELAGTYDQRWTERKRPLLPDDYDPNYLLCSPADQRVQPRLAGGESVILVNMTPEGVVGIELPRLAFTATTRIRRRSVKHGFELASVVVEPDEQRLIMVWQSWVCVAAPELDDLRSTRIREVHT